MDEERHEKHRYIGHMAPGAGRAMATQPAIQTTLKVAGKKTGGAYSLFELSVEPGGKEWLHIQHCEDEWYVLSARFAFVIEGEKFSIGEGGTVYVPKGTLHGFENEGEYPGRMLVIYTPGGSHERFLEEATRLSSVANDPLSTPTPDSETNLVRLRSLKASHGIEIAPHSNPGSSQGAT